MSATPVREPVRVFCEYHPKDRRFYDDLARQLSPSLDAKLLALRHRDSVPAGAAHQEALEQEIAGADIVVLLVSSWLTGDRSSCARMNQAVKAAEEGESLLVPILARQVELSNTLLHGLQLFPRGGNALSGLGRLRDKALVDIVAEILRTAKEIRQRASTPTPSPAGAASTGAISLSGVTLRRHRAHELKYRGRGREALKELEVALKELEVLLQEEPDNREYRKERAHLFDRMGQYRYALGELRAARSAFDLTFDIRRDLHARNPQETDVLFDLSTSHYWRGYLHYLRDEIEQARAEQQAGLALCQELCLRDPGDSKALRSLVVLQTDLGTTLWEMGQHAVAEQHLRDALEKARRLFGDNPDNLQSRRDLSVGLFRLADLLVERGELGAALHLLEESVRVCWELTDLAPTNVQWRRHLATARISMGDARMSTGDRLRARGDYEFAAGTMGALFALEKEDVQGARHLAKSEKKLGDHLCRVGDMAGAIAAYSRAAAAIRAACAVEESERCGRERSEIEAALSRVQASLQGPASPS